MKRLALLICLAQAGLSAQEANSGFELRTSISAGAFYTPRLQAFPRSGEPVAGGLRMILYPIWKLSQHWTVSAAIQAHSRPYFFEELGTQGYGLRNQLLQANITYSQFWQGGSVAVRLGQLSTAFGSFLLRYDDADNPLIDVPLAYGYYYKSVSILGLTGAEVDLNVGKLDARAQLTNSSPANPRSIFDHDQYGNWAGGFGYTIRQGLRVGASAYRGPYLDREYAYYFPGEAPPHSLPATAFGVDVQWGRGPLNVYGEWQRFNLDYRAIPTFKQHTGYVEARWVLHPRWYIASRIGYLRANAGTSLQTNEFTAGFRPNRYQVAKLSYEIAPGQQSRSTRDNTLAIQLVTSFRAFTLAGN